MTSKNFEGLHDLKRLLDIEIMESPSEKLPKDGCITFWYYLNTTDVRPIATAAQILVYLKYHDTGGKPQLLWYDNINRPFLTWRQGGVSVEGNRSVSLVVTAKTTLPTYSNYPGVVSLDDVEYEAGPCRVRYPGIRSSYWSQ